VLQLTAALLRAHLLTTAVKLAPAELEHLKGAALGEALRQRRVRALA
jgi:hypothetical protein